MPTAPYGSWPSPITPDLLVQQVVSLSQVESIEGVLWWNEGRPADAGRYVVVRREPDGTTTDAIPAGFSARTMVHEYGGASYAVHGDTLFFANFADQRLHRVDPGGEPVAITEDNGHRFADFTVTPDGRSLLAVRERHLDGGDVVNDIVAVPTDNGDVMVLAEGHDFYSAPRLSPDGRQLVWLSWDHPNMPWDGTELWVANLTTGFGMDVPRLVAGGREESISQPRWSPDGVLHWVSDRTGWWNLYRGDGESVAAMAAEFTGPDWVFGQSTYAFLDDGSLVAAWSSEGLTTLGVLRPDAETFDRIDVPYTAIGSIRPHGQRIAAIAASPHEEPAVVVIDVGSGDVEVMKRARQSAVGAEWLSAPQPVEFPTERGKTAHALYYAPHNPDYEGPDHEGPAGERPPLVVVSHGGPTAAASAALSLGIQFWTTRGIAVVDVNYGGSTGYGREYRQRLNGEWGIVDVDDCVDAARFLAADGRVDPDRLIIRGGSAGGYTTLCALTFRDVFAAGASYYGVADAEALALHTHKFESRYLDGLIGPYPEAAAVYRERSPIHFADRLSAPLIIFQGLEDKIVPPEQADVMVDALRANGLPFAYIAFEGEQHGFRKAESIRRAAGAELAFYGAVFGFTPADPIDPVPIENL